MKCFLNVYSYIQISWVLNGELSQYVLIEVREFVIGELGPLIVPSA